jgi:hypothetical protein
LPIRWSRAAVGGTMLLHGIEKLVVITFTVFERSGNRRGLGGSYDGDYGSGRWRSPAVAS